MLGPQDKASTLTIGWKEPFGVHRLVNDEFLGKLGAASGVLELVGTDRVGPDHVAAAVKVFFVGVTTPHQQILVELRHVPVGIVVRLDHVGQSFLPVVVLVDNGKESTSLVEQIFVSFRTVQPEDIPVLFEFVGQGFGPRTGHDEANPRHVLGPCLANRLSFGGVCRQNSDKQLKGSDIGIAKALQVGFQVQT